MAGFPRVKSFRFTIAFVLLGLYAGIALSPLAPLALNLAPGAIPVNGECSGECDIDGCSPESRSKHTCCCWNKKQQSMKKAGKISGVSCNVHIARLSPGEGSIRSSVEGRSNSSPSKSPCCPTERSDNIEHSTEPETDEVSDKIYKCGSPCGDSRQHVFCGSGKIEIIPFYFSGLPTVSVEDMIEPLPHPRLTSRYIDPPDPPPKLSMTV